MNVAITSRPAVVPQQKPMTAQHRPTPSAPPLPTPAATKAPATPELDVMLMSPEAFESLLNGKKAPKNIATKPAANGEFDYMVVPTSLFEELSAAPKPQPVKDSITHPAPSAPMWPGDAAFATPKPAAGHSVPSAPPLPKGAVFGMPSTALGIPHTALGMPVAHRPMPAMGYPMPFSPMFSARPQMQQFDAMLMLALLSFLDEPQPTHTKPAVNNNKPTPAAAKESKPAAPAPAAKAPVAETAPKAEIFCNAHDVVVDDLCKNLKTNGDNWSADEKKKLVTKLNDVTALNKKATKAGKWGKKLSAVPLLGAAVNLHFSRVAKKAHTAAANVNSMLADKLTPYKVDTTQEEERKNVIISTSKIAAAAQHSALFNTAGTGVIAGSASLAAFVAPAAIIGAASGVLMLHSARQSASTAYAQQQRVGNLFEALKQRLNQDGGLNVAYTPAPVHAPTL